MFNLSLHNDYRVGQIVCQRCARFLHTAVAVQRDALLLREAAKIDCGGVDIANSCRKQPRKVIDSEHACMVQRATMFW